MPASSAPADPPEKKIDWEAAKACLAELQRNAPSILNQGVIIGGIACWFYRHQLVKAQDIDFKLPNFTPAEEKAWLSKDIDFTNFFAQDARELLKNHVSTDSHGRPHIVLAGIPIGFAQIGVTFDPEIAWIESWIGMFEQNEISVQCRILDPITLYREKVALVQKRGLESDRLHRSLVAEYLRYETCRQTKILVESRTPGEKSVPLKFLFAVRDRALEVCQDDRVRRRLLGNVSITNLGPAEQKIIHEIANQALS